ncbi:helix-turn-helix transcriptional regulator [Hoeflea sp. AS60]|uniref:helix-turn-helix transcriptional regulator n=1 Tax=Hoeflea sp. AS60 TaxID=3135780 RepID=UPI00317650F2
MTSVYRLIEDCIAAGSGGDDFIPRVLTLVEWMGASQLMVFEMVDDHVVCLLSRNYSRHRTGELLARRYMDGWFRQDPLLPELMNIRAGQTSLWRMEDIVSSMSPDYLDIFFNQPGLAGKKTVLAAGSTRRMMVNFYHSEPVVTEPDEALLSLVARMVLVHFEARPASSYPACLAALSERERQVCLGVLDGKKTEMIAGELGLSPATIVTYRRRAYEKLGISSRGGLFALCRQL